MGNEQSQHISLGPADGHRSHQARNLLYESLMQVPAYLSVLEGCEHRIEVANENFTRLLGRTAVIGHRLQEMVPEMIARDLVPLLNQVFQTGEPASRNEVPFVLEHPEPQRRYFNFIFQPLRSVGGIVTGIMVHGVDITEQVETRRALKNSEERLKLALNASQAGIWFWDVALNQISWSVELEALFGLKPGQFSGKYEDYIARTHPEDRESLQAAVQRAIETKKPYEVEHRVIWPDGQTRWLEGKGQAFYDDQGKLVKMTGTTCDITTRKRQEEALKRKTEELDQFAAIAAHDLKAPLNSITQFTQLLGEEYSGKFDESADQYIGFILGAGKRMTAFIDSLLSYARAGEAESESHQSVCLKKVFQEVQKNLWHGIAQSKATIRLPEELPLIQGNEIQLLQLMQNLLSNAIKYRSPERDPLIEVQCEELSNLWKFIIRDNGIGIEENEQPRIFDFFHRIHSQRKLEGSGIGLAVCKRIVESHGGEIHVQSAPGEGSQFIFTLTK